MNTQEILGIAAIGGALAIPLVIGLIASMKARPTTSDYFVQGRAMGPIALFFTVQATWWSAFAFLGSNANFYLYGPAYWTAVIFNIFFGIMYYWIGKKVWFHGKTGKYLTARDFFVDLYRSPRLATFIAVILLVFSLPHLQIQLTGGAYLIDVASGGTIPFWVGGLLFYTVIIAYVWAGGLRAIAWTDIFYGVGIFFGLIAAGVFVLGEVGGMGTMFDQIEQVRPENLILGDGMWMYWIALAVITPVGALMTPQLWTRMYAAKSPRSFDLMPFLLGLVAIAYIGAMVIGNSAVLLEPDVEQPDHVLPIMLLEYAPLLLALLVIAAGAGAAMSTANSQVHAMAASYTIDFHSRYIQKDLPERKRIWVGRWAILAFCAIAYVMALYIPGLLIAIGLVAYAGLAQVIVPTVGALFWRRASVAGATSGLIVGITTLVLFTIFPALVPGPFSVHGAGLLSLLLNVVVFISVSLLTRPRSSDLLLKIRRRQQDFDEERWDDTLAEPETTSAADTTHIR
ncbi:MULTISPECIES: sodium:solute symporter family protein [Actinomycetes]|uniref:Sodium:solute symporter family protein n=2 Tax=Actinomycetes TaxID=1760 RepID=A0ABP6LS79_9MICC